MNVEDESVSAIFYLFTIGMTAIPREMIYNYIFAMIDREI